MAARLSSPSPPPPPVIGKSGPYTVFITPPATPAPSEASRSGNPSSGPKFLVPPPSEASRSPKVEDSTPPAKEVGKFPAVAPPPVQVPPPQFEKRNGANSSGSVFGFLWDAVAKVQDAHSSLDQYMSDWLGLDQSRYQWALNDYYENHGTGKKDAEKPREVASKLQAV